MEILKENNYEASESEKKNMRKKVSVIIPYHEGNCRFIEYCFNSIVAQSFRDFEVIIVVDGSPLPFIPKNKEIYIIILENKTGKKGAGVTRNIGMNNSVGEYIKVLDSDDAVFPIYLEKCVKILDNNSNIGLVYTDYSVIDKDNQFLRRVKAFDFDLSKFLETNFIGCLTVMFRRNDFRFNEDMDFWEDYEYWLRLTQKYHFFHIPDFLAEYRDHEGQSSKHVISPYKDIFYLEKIRSEIRKSVGEKI